MNDLAAPGLGAALAVGVTAAVAIRHLVWLTRVESWSMAPTLRPGNLLLTRRLRRADPVRRGDIVVVNSAELGRRIVKRVVGLAGETVEVDDRGVRVDGVPLPEPYGPVNGGAGGSYTVPRGAYLVLGDNRARSSDSRSWRQPFVARSAIEGRWIGRVAASNPERSAGSDDRPAGHGRGRRLPYPAGERGPKPAGSP